MTTETVRLHISPLTPALLPKVLGPTLTSLASNVAFGEIETFPEHNYGFIDLPAADAERLKKKLGGAIFKGAKMKVDDARPKKRRRTDASPEMVEGPQPVAATKATTSKKRRKPASENVVSGHELSPERTVKRAWTEPRKGKKNKHTDAVTQQQPSKYTENEELLFRTKIPSNKTDLVTKKGKKAKKSKYGAEELIVHEFEKTISQPSFLKADRMEDRTNLTYEDGKGWVNDEGVVVEPEPPSLAQRRERGSRKPKAKSLRKRAEPILREAMPPDRFESHDQRKPRSHQLAEAQTTTEEDEIIEDEKADGDAEDDGSSNDDPAESSTPVSTAIDDKDRDQDETHQSTKSPEIHPLESLFKKPRKPASQDVAKPSLEISTGFSFFDHDTDEDDVDPKMPLTPFTSQDLRNRGLRSAAPTPDTAYPSRFNSHDSVRTSEDEEGLQEEDLATHGDGDKSLEQGVSSPSKINDSAVSEFEKLFWEKRGDNNRAWKARRRAVLKEKRHRENRARRPKNW